MGSLEAGVVVILPFAFSDLGGKKFRPALLIAEVGLGDHVACQITSAPFSDPRALKIAGVDFEDGGLRMESYVRPGKLFTANESLFRGVAGKLRTNSLSNIREAVVAIVRGS